MSAVRSQAYLRLGQKRNTEVVSHPVHAHVRDTESMTIVTAAATARAAEDFELEAEVLLTASAPSHEAERTVTTAATVADAMIVITATVITTAIVTMTVMTGVDAATGVETVDDRTADTRFMRSMTTSRLIPRAMDHRLLSGGRRLRRGGTTEEEMNEVELRDEEYKQIKSGCALVLNPAATADENNSRLTTANTNERMTMEFYDGTTNPNCAF